MLCVNALTAIATRMPRTLFCGRCFNGLACLIIALSGCILSSPIMAEDAKRIFMVSSYHQDYAPERRARYGLLTGLRKIGLASLSAHTLAFLETGQLDSRRLIIRQSWLDAARTHSTTELARRSAQVILEIEAFKPHLILLSDNPAIQQIGRTLVDGPTPVVYWGLNGLPMLYGLVNSIEHPGRNVTGVWQTGKHSEALRLLKKLKPDAKTFAVLADRSTSALINIKQIRALDQTNALPMRLKSVVQTHVLEDFKQQALTMADQVDAFYILSHAGLLDQNKNVVDNRAVADWYFKNISKPSVSNEGYIALQGMLAAIDDSGYEQAQIAAEMIDAILNRGISPSILRIRDFKSPRTFVNTQRARQLNIPIDPQMLFIDRRITTMEALGFTAATTTTSTTSASVNAPEHEGQLP